MTGSRLADRFIFYRVDVDESNYLITRRQSDLLWSPPLGARFGDAGATTMRFDHQLTKQLNPRSPTSSGDTRGDSRIQLTDSK